ncbi:MAG: hypothetical protein JXA11_13090 [Phycisphaerae bacterium]|nr:hypothetical protein [Phycisphaerae bacterium]
MHAFRKQLVLSLLLILPGCATPTATVELIGVAKKTLASASQVRQNSHERIVQQYQAQQKALDAAFDADVRLVAAGELKNADGEPIPLSADWIVAARKGYSAARDLLSEQIQTEQAAHTVEQDNLAAAAEALRMAEELTILQWNVSERIKQQFLKLTKQKEADHGE